uniref:S-norcoclaurine synthase 1 n=2 Tax=Anthurium amnicola TaxID=1678845 RepID=A0A1D1YAI9_9ARAE
MGMGEEGKQRRTQLGGSLPVPNVQSLAASCTSPSTVPDRYLRPDLDGHVVVHGDAEQLPVIDLAVLLGEGRPSSRDEAAKLRSACEDWGFFQLVNHGVGEEAVESMKAAMEGFFSQPLEEKMGSSEQRAGSIEGYGQAFVVSDEQKLDWGDMLFFYAQPPDLKNTRLWPSHPPTFRSALEKYSMEVKKVALSLLRQLGGELGLEAEELTGLFQEGVQGVRMNYYPHHTGRLLGISPHSDAVGLTLLLQVNPVQGLQIRRAGRWIPVCPMPGALVVNVGDVLQILSNGQYKSIEHRVIINAEKERLSIAAFHSPNLDCLIGPLPELVKEGEQRYNTLRSEDYARLVISSKLDGKNLLDSMKVRA